MRAAAGGGFVVILRNEFRDGLGEFVAESRPVRRRPEANLGIHRQGRQAFARLFRTPNEVTDLADDPRAQGDEIARGQPIDFPIRINRDRAQGARRNDVGSSRRHEQPFRQPAPLAFLGQPHQPVRLQGVQVVVDLLPSQADPRGQCRRRGGRGQLGEEPAAHRLQGHRRRRRIIDDLDVEHEEMVSLTTFIVKGDPTPNGTFECRDMATAEFEEGRFTAIVSLFSVFHLPVQEHRPLLARMFSWLRSGGYLLISLGHSAWTGYEEDWYGAPMYWSHADEQTSLKWLDETGFEVLWREFLPEGKGG